jgi:polyisoprenyl-teichoic acid--peptidoglycan teichoic acid transferase
MEQQNETVVNQQAVQPDWQVYHSDAVIPPPPRTRLRETSAARQRARKRRVRSEFRGGEWAWVVIAVAVLGAVITLSMSVSLMLRAAQEQPEVMPTAGAILPTPVNTGGNNAAQQVILNDGSAMQLVPWNGTSRFTVLLMGLDRRPDETGLAYRTDTILLVSIDPATNSMGILSIPRDLYVDVPGYDLQRVNSPMVLGELRQPGYGPSLAMQTVQNNLGIRVHDYLVVDFQAFADFIDMIGGIDIDIPYNISDPLYPDMNYGYDPFYIKAGLQHLDGTTALKYARTRHGDNDFQRAYRQQLVIYAIRDRLTNPEMLPQLIINSPSMWETLQDGVYTGLSLDSIVQLALYVKDIPAENIRTGVINEGYVMDYSTSDGASVLVPDRAKLGELMVEVFGADYSQ